MGFNSGFKGLNTNAYDLRTNIPYRDRTKLLPSLSMVVGVYFQRHVISLCQFQFHIPLPPHLFTENTPRHGKRNRFMSQQSAAVED